jgi:hypothetical protein
MDGKAPETVLIENTLRDFLDEKAEVKSAVLLQPIEIRN